MAPTPVSASVPIEQHILKSDEAVVLSDPQFSSYLLTVLKKNARLGPDDPMSINGDTGKTLSYQQFLEQTVRTVNGLRALGLVPGDAVSFIARNQVYTFSTSIAIYIAALLQHPLFPYLEAELVAEQIQTVKPRLIFTEAFALDKVRAAIKPMSPKPRVVVFDSETVDANMLTMEEFLRLGSSVDLETFEEGYVESPAEDDALIIFTTGSTGVPKPVVHTTKNVHSLMHMSSNMLDSPLLMGPFVSWIAGHCTMLSAINDRITHVYSLELNLDKQEQFIKEYKIRSVVGSPFSALQLALKGPYPEHLERIIVGGSPMRKATEQIIRKAMGPNASLQPVYGSTETGLVVGQRYRGDANHHFSNGHMMPGAELQIRDLRTGRPVGPNQKGEVLIRSHSITKGYLNNPKLTSEIIDEHGWIKMGDLGYYDEDNFVYILDRLKDIVFYKEHIILPSELSDVIRLHPDVQDAAVCALPDPQDRHRPLAFISMKPGKSMTEDEVNEHILKYLDDTHILRGGVVFLDRVPRTLSGKVVSTDLSKKIQQMVDTTAS